MRLTTVRQADFLPADARTSSIAVSSEVRSRSYTRRCSGAPGIAVFGSMSKDREVESRSDSLIALKIARLERFLKAGEPGGIRTRDTLIKGYLALNGVAA